MKSTSEVLDRLEAVTANGNGWMARCPAHDDRNPSLSIRETTDGTILFHCFAGCATEDIVEALGLSMVDLFPEEQGHFSAQVRSGTFARNGQSTSEKASPSVATFEDVQRWHEGLMSEASEAEAARTYLTDVRGIDLDLLRARYVGLVRDPKQRDGVVCPWWIVFPADLDTGRKAIASLKAFAFHPEAGDWMRNQAGKKICRNAGPTGLISLLHEPPADQPRGGEAAGPVLYVGGEIDAFSAHSVGFDVLTGTGGEKPPKDRWVKKIADSVIAERDIVVCFDGDETGRRMAPRAARKLQDAGLSVRVANLPDGNDVNDLVVEGGREAVQRVVDAAAPPPPPSANNAGSNGEEAGRSESGSQARTQSEHLLQLAGGIELFHSPDETAYATFEVGGVTHTATIGSSLVADLLRRRFYEAEGRPPSAQALQDAKDVLRARARFDGPEREVHVRVAGREGRIYIDLCNGEGEAVEVTPGGWSVIDMGDAPVRFRRTAAMKPLPRPRRGGSVGLLRRHVPVQDDEAFALLCGYLTQALRPTGPYPPLELTGEQGAGKTTTERMIRALIDPSCVPIRACPRNVRDLVVAAENNWALAYDNLSGLQAWLSDAFCRLSTGGGFGTRRLYSNREEELFYALRPVILNGIDDITTRGDLADRAITLRLSAIPEDERRTESDVWAAFEADRPLILGALYDVLSTALSRVDDVELEELPRMADFAEWVVAGEPALPIDEGAFMAAYTRNRAHAREDAVAGDTVASAIVDMLSDDSRERPRRWTGSMSELLEDLRAYLPHPEKPPRSFPDTHQAMTAKLRRVMPALRSLGVTKEDLPRTSSRRAFALQIDCPGAPASPASSVSQSGAGGAQVGPRDDTGAGDAPHGVSSRVPENAGSARSEEDNDAHDTHDAVLPYQSMNGSTSVRKDDESPSGRARPPDPEGGRTRGHKQREAPF
jgi:hypothetical protein